MNIKVRFDFYQVEGVKPDELVREMDSKLLNNKTTIQHKGTYLRLENYEVRDGVRLGTAVKIHASNLPSKANLRMPGIESLPLAADEGVTTPTAFLYSPTYNVFVIQRSQTGVRAGSFLHLIHRLTDIKEIGLNIMPLPDKIERFYKMSHISKMEYKLRLASPTSQQAFDDLSVEESAKIARHFGARYVKMELGVGTGYKESLPLQKVVSAVRSMLRINDQADTQTVSVNSLIIRGKDTDDDNLAPLDLINERIMAEIDVPLSNRSLHKESVERAAWSAYLDKEDQLRHYKPI